MSGKYDGSLVYDTKINTDGFEQGSKKIKDEAKKTGNEAKKSLEDTRASLEGINKVAKTVLLTTASVGAGILAMGINYNSQMEQYSAGFTTMLGSAEKAQKMMGNLKDFAAKTPFELTDLANASTTLLAFGEDVEQLMPDLKMLGDISLGNAEKFKGLALVFGQVQSQGRLMGQDLLQMINQGFNPLQIISEKTGKSVATLKDEMAKGQITFEMVADAMKTATSEGGQFYNAMEAQSKTLQGQWSTLKDNVTALTGEMASDISEKLTTTVLPDLIDKVDELSQMWEDGSLQDSIGTAVSAIAAFGTAIAALNIILFVNDMMELTKGVKDYTTATKAGAAAQKLMNAELLKNPYTLILAALVALTAGIITYAATHESEYEKIANAHKEAISEIKNSTEEIIDSHEKAVQAIKQRENEEIAAAEVAKAYKNDLFDLDKQLKSGTLTQEEATAVTEDFKIVAEKLEEIIPGITNCLFDETGQINLQEDAVNKLCDAYYDLVVAKATANAAEELIGESAKNILKLKNEQKKAHDKADSIRDEIETIPYKINAIDYDGDGKAEKEVKQYHHLDAATVKMRNEDIEELQKTWNTAEEQIKKLEAEQDTYIDLLKETNSEIEKQTNAQKDLTGGAKETGDKIAGTVTNTARQTTKTLETEQEKQLRNLKHRLEMGEISHEEYYKKLAEYRNTYFEEGSSEWQQYTEEIYDYYIGELERVQEEADRVMTELKEKQQSIKDNLYDDANMGFSKVTIKYGEGQTEEYFKLADMSSQNKQLQTYSDLLDELFAKRGELPEDVLNQLSTMSTEDGIKYVESMLKASDSEWDEYVSAFLQREGIAEKISNQLVSSELDEAKKKLEEKFGEVPEDFFGIGEDSASYFGEGFMSKLEGLMQQVRDRIMSEMNAMIPASISYAGAGGVGGNINNTYTNNYTFNSSKDTTTQQLRAANDAATMTRLRGGN